MKTIFPRIPQTDIEFIDPNMIPDEPLDSFYLDRPLGILDYLKKYPNIYYVVLDDEFHEAYNYFNIHYYSPNDKIEMQMEDVDQIYLIKNQVDKLLSISYHSAKEETIKKLVYLMKNIKKSSTSC